MTVLVVGKFYREGFALHIADTLQDMGHEVVRFEPGLKLSQVNGMLRYRAQMAKQMVFEIYSKSSFHRTRAVDRLKATSSNKNIGLTIVCHDLLTPEEVNAIRKSTGGPVVLWFPDAISNFGKAMFLDSEYTALFFKEPFVVDVLRNEYGKNAFYLPECCNPIYHRRQQIFPADLLKFRCDITTAGNMHTARSSLFKQLRKYDVKIWGNPAPRWLDARGLEGMIQHEFVSDDDKAKAFLCAKIVLNNVYPTEIWGVNVRTFEIAGSGGFQIVNFRKSLTHLYTEGSEIICYRNVPELIEKIDYYLEHEEERVAISKNSERRTLKDHTYERRLELMLATVEGVAKGYPWE